MPNEVKTTKRQTINEFFPLFKEFNNPERFIKKVPTGFDQLDKILGGGLTNGIHTVCAWPGTGKTTLMLNIAMNAAKANIPVLFFSYEMSPLDLTTRIYSCVSNELAQSKGGFTFDDLRLERKISAAEKKLYSKSVECVERDFIDSISFFNCREERYTAKDIADEIDLFVSENKKYPLVVVDYLQLIESESNVSMKTSVDNAMITLHDVTQRHQLAMIAISSITKQYNEKLTMFSCAESARIPYTSVTVWGLSVLNENEESAYKTIQLEIFKNRYGESNKTLTFSFDAAYSKFAEFKEPPKSKSRKTQK